MAQGNFLQSLFNRQPQMQPMIRPEDLPAYQAEQAKIAEQRAQPTLMNGLRNLVQDPTSALFGKQSPVQEQPIIGIDMTQQDYNNLAQQGLAPQISMGAAQNPRTGGLLNDIASGFRENSNTPFAVSNLEPQQNKGFATRLGEGLGSAARFADSPLGRMALTAGVVGATGGSGLQALTYGATAGVGNQNLRTQDQFYRNQLQNEGVDTSQIQGYVTPEMYKNQSLGKYRVESLRVRNQIAQQTDNTKRAKMIVDGFTNGIFSETEAIEQAKLYGMTIDDLKASNQTRNTDFNERLVEPRVKYYEAMPRIAGGRLALQGQQLASQNERFDRQLEEGEKPVTSDTTYNRDKFGNVISSTTTRKKGQPQAKTTQKVTVEKDGKKYYLPASQLQEAIKQGYKKI